MKTINLVSLENSDVKYKINNYPDGQRDIVILDEKLGGNFYDLRNVEGARQIVQIKSRLNNMEDLGLIICATQALRNLGVKEIHLYVPYIVGLRSDRLFQEGGVRYIKDILAPILNSQNFESVTCYDAHSFVAENCINRLEVIDNVELVRYAILEIYKDAYLKRKQKGEIQIEQPFILVSPDDGASKKIYKVAEAIGYKGDVIICSKSRDVDGKLSKTNVPRKEIQDNWFKDRIIIDDIGDGCNTFINIIKSINLQQADRPKGGKNYLIITHGIFSKGFEELSKYFDGIYSTNSYRDFGDYVGNEMDKTNLKQLNVF